MTTAEFIEQMEQPEQYLGAVTYSEQAYELALLLEQIEQNLDHLDHRLEVAASLWKTLRHAVTTCPRCKEVVS